MQQKLLKDRGNLKLAFTDVFHTAPWDAIQELPGLYMDLAGGWESQQIRLTFSYILGNQQVKAARNRKKNRRCQRPCWQRRRTINDSIGLVNKAGSNVCFFMVNSPH